MGKAFTFAAILFVIAWIAGCGQSDLPRNARDWLNHYEEMGKESVEIARRAKTLDLKDAAAVKAHNEAGLAYFEKMQSMIEEGRKIGDSLSKPQKKRFYEETDSIKSRIEDEREELKSGG